MLRLKEDAPLVAESHRSLIQQTPSGRLLVAGVVDSGVDETDVVQSSLCAGQPKPSPAQPEAKVGARGERMGK